MLLKTHLLMSQTSIWITLKPVGRWIIKSTSVSNMMTLIHSHSFDTCKLLYNLTTCKWKQSRTTLTAHAYKLRECSWERGWKLKISWHPIRFIFFLSKSSHFASSYSDICLLCCERITMEQLAGCRGFPLPINSICVCTNCWVSM